jgi:hypothetical protein
MEHHTTVGAEVGTDMRIRSGMMNVISWKTWAGVIKHGSGFRKCSVNGYHGRNGSGVFEYEIGGRGMGAGNY